MSLQSQTAPRAVAAPRGGIIAIGGPPCSGKSPLAARLSQVLPEPVVFEATDNLARSKPFWQPGGPDGERVSRPEPKLLAAAQLRWQRGPSRRAPTILVVSRFETPRARARARAAAADAEARFLFVEANTRAVRALRRLTRLTMRPDEVLARMERFDKERGRYVAVTKREAIALPAVRLSSSLGDLDAAVRQVLDTWQRI